MAEVIQTDIKSVEQAREASIQARATDEGYMGASGFLLYLNQGASLVSPWWSYQRDVDLDTFWKRSDHLSGSLALLSAKVSTIPVRVEPRDVSLKSHQKQAEEFTIRLIEESDFGLGWVTLVSKVLLDWWASDNGLFIEVIGDGKPDGPIQGPALGLAHLDAHRTCRTGNAEYPVTYTSTDGKVSKLHWTRIAYASDSPSSREEMMGVGFSAISRCINVAQNLVDVGIYHQEKLGSRPLRGILQSKGIRHDVVSGALKVANEVMDNQALSRFAKLPIVEMPTEAGLEMLDLASLPDNFDHESSTRLGMFAVALAFGVPIRWIWPAAVSGATKADAMYQHIAGLGGGIGKVLRVLTLLLGGDPRGAYHSKGKFLPPHLKLVFDFQDDEQDRAQAEIKEKRSKTRKEDLDAGVIDVRAAREQALSDGDISQAQFNRMELDEGRLPDGANVLTLFNSVDSFLLEALDLGVDEPLATDVNDPFMMLGEIGAAALTAQDVMANSSTAKARERAGQALAALGALKALYTPLATQQVQREMQQEAAQSERLEVRPEKEEKKPAEGEEEEKPAEGQKKMFDFSASVGEVIGGELARGAGGEFISIEQLKEQIRQGIVARLAGRSAKPGGKAGAAAARRAENRAEVEGKLGLAEGTMDALAAMRTGDASDDQMQEMLTSGFAQVNADGTVTMSGAGRSILSAGGSGDIDRAKTALARASEPPKGAAPAKPRKPGRAERERARQQRESANRAKVSEAASDTVSEEDFTALTSFRAGGTLDEATADRLAQGGLVEIDDRGNARMTRSGGSFLAAADNGDTRKAMDTLSHAADAVSATLERAQAFRGQADAMSERASQIDDAMAELAMEISAGTATATDAAEQMAALREAARMLREREAELREEADGLEARVGSLGVEAKRFTPAPRSKSSYLKKQFTRAAVSIQAAAERVGLKSSEELQELQPTIHVHMPEQTAPVTNLTLQVPEQKTVMAEGRRWWQKAQVVTPQVQVEPHIEINVPEREVHIDAPISVEIPERAVLVETPVNVQVPAPVVQAGDIHVDAPPPARVDVTVDATVRPPDKVVETETFVERDPRSGRIVKTTKRTEAK